MAGVDNSAILLKSDYQFKDPLTENYVLKLLRGQFVIAPRYYADKTSEIDFVLQHSTQIIPVEAKGGVRGSLFQARLFENGEITNIPLYLAGRMRELL